MSTESSAIAAARLRFIVRVLHRYRLTIAATTVLGLAAAVTAVMLSTDVYEARARLLIDPEGPNIVDFRPVVEEQTASATYYQTQYQLLQSRTLALKTFEDAELESLPEFTELPQPPPRWRRALSGLVATLRQRIAPPAEEAPSTVPVVDVGETREQSRAINRLLRGLRVAPVNNSRLVDVYFRSTDRRLAAFVVNAHAVAFVEQNLERRAGASREASDWLRQQLEEERQSVAESEWALQRYIEENGTFTFEDNQSIVGQQLANLTEAVTTARMARIEAETRYNRLLSIREDRRLLEAFPDILSDPFIREQRAQLSTLQREDASLSETLGERHPRILEVRSAIDSIEGRIDREVASIVESVRNEFMAAREHELSLAAALESSKAEALSLNQKGIEYGVLKRDVDSNREIYEALLQRAKETGVAGKLEANNIRIVDYAAVPGAPIGLGPTMTVLAGLVAGVLLGMVAALGFECLDVRIKTPDDIREHLGLSALALVPVLAEVEAGTTPLLKDGAPAGFREAFRTLRTNLLFGLGGSKGAGRCLLVTSSAPDEGKTLVACNLALTLAEASQRVLLIDADLRLPSMHEVFDKAAEPGLSELIAGKTSVPQALEEAGPAGLWLLTSGQVPPNAPELLGSQAFEALLGAFRRSFDWIVVDSSPLLAVTDSAVIAPLADSVLFVVAAERTEREGAQSALDQLTSVGAKLHGAVLNRTPVERDSYYYSRYWRGDYLNRYYGQAATDFRIARGVSPRRPAGLGLSS